MSFAYATAFGAWGGGTNLLYFLWLHYWVVSTCRLCSSSFNASWSKIFCSRIDMTSQNDTLVGAFFNFYTMLSVLTIWALALNGCISLILEQNVSTQLGLVSCSSLFPPMVCYVAMKRLDDGWWGFLFLWEWSTQLWMLKILLYVLSYDPSLWSCVVIWLHLWNMSHWSFLCEHNLFLF